MKKRILCFLLSAVIILGMVPAMTVSAASDMKTSDDCIGLIEALEGFSRLPYGDNGKYYIGYGTACTTAEYEKYKDTGITTDEAHAMLCNHIAGLEDKLNAFMDNNGLSLKQRQFDGLICFTYNVGYAWMYNTSSTIRAAVVNKAAGNDFIYAISQWCNVTTEEGKVVLPGLITRRLIEANMYLNGVYSKTLPDNLRYVIYDKNSENALCSLSAQGFDATSYDSLRAVPTLTGYRFMGWYTEAAGGEWVSALGSNIKTKTTLYAHWQQDGATEPSAVSYTCRAPGTGLPVYESWSASSVEIDRLEASEKVSIVAEFLDDSGVKWGKLSTGGWIDLSMTNNKLIVDEDPASRLDTPLEVVVTSSGVNIRSGPGTNYEKLGTFEQGQELTITAIQQGGNYRWGKSSLGWICMDYTDQQLASSTNSEEAKVVTATGTIIKTNKLNIRSGPGTTYSVVGQYSRGDSVKISLQQKVGSTTWGLTEKGWISLYYVDLTPVAAGTVPDMDFTPSTEEDTTGGGTTVDGTTAVSIKGYVTGCNNLNVRSGPGTGNSKVGSLSRNTSVVITETVVVGKTTWGRISTGWISMDYVKITEDTAESGTGTTDTSTTGTGGTIVKCTSLNIRQYPGTNYAKVGKYTKGTRVQILETAKVGNATWGRTDQGWIHLYYVQLDSAVQTPSTGTTEETGGDTTQVPTEITVTSDGSTAVLMTGVIYKTDTLRVRSAPGTASAHIGDLKKDDQVKIYQIANEGRSTWGRTDKGWILLYYVYVDLDSCSASVKTVTSTTLNARKEPGTGSEKTGIYYRGQRVIILEQTELNGTAWGRTEYGWICMDYVQ